jgi:hypothetical protein
MWIKQLDDEIAYIYYPGFPKYSPELGLGIFISETVFEHEMSYIVAVLERAKANFAAVCKEFMEEGK